MYRHLRRQFSELEIELAKRPEKDSLICLLQEGANHLSKVGKSPTPLLLKSVESFRDAILHPDLLNHYDRDVRFLVSACVRVIEPAHLPTDVVCSIISESHLRFIRRCKVLSKEIHGVIKSVGFYKAARISGSIAYAYNPPEQGLIAIGIVQLHDIIQTYLAADFAIVPVNKCEFIVAEDLGLSHPSHRHLIYSSSGCLHLVGVEAFTKETGGQCHKPWRKIFLISIEGHSIEEIREVPMVSMGNEFFLDGKTVGVLCSKREGVEITLYRNGQWENTLIVGPNPIHWSSKAYFHEGFLYRVGNKGRGSCLYKMELGIENSFEIVSDDCKYVFGRLHRVFGEDNSFCWGFERDNFKDVCLVRKGGVQIWKKVIPKGYRVLPLMHLESAGVLLTVETQLYNGISRCCIRFHFAEDGDSRYGELVYLEGHVHGDSLRF